MTDNLASYQQRLETSLAYNVGNNCGIANGLGTIDAYGEYCVNLIHFPDAVTITDIYACIAPSSATGELELRCETTTGSGTSMTASGTLYGTGTNATFANSSPAVQWVKFTLASPLNVTADTVVAFKFIASNPASVPNLAVQGQNLTHRGGWYTGSPKSLEYATGTSYTSTTAHLSRNTASRVAPSAGSMTTLLGPALLFENNGVAVPLKSNGYNPLFYSQSNTTPSGFASATNLMGNLVTVPNDGDYNLYGVMMHGLPPRDTTGDSFFILDISDNVVASYDIERNNLIDGYVFGNLYTQGSQSFPWEILFETPVLLKAGQSYRIVQLRGSTITPLQTLNVANSWSFDSTLTSAQINTYTTDGWTFALTYGNLSAPNTFDAWTTRDGAWGDMVKMQLAAAKIIVEPQKGSITGD